MRIADLRFAITALAMLCFMHARAQNPPVVGAISGKTSVCSASSITLADTTAGGVWKSSNTAVAIVNSSGMVTGLAGGNDSITYSVTNSFGTTTVIYPIAVNALPTVSIAPISPITFCSGDLVQLVANGSGGGSGLILDQSQLVYNAGTGARNLTGYSVWQSFAAGITGTLAQIDIGFFNTINGTGTLNIYAGSGTAGALLQSQTVTVVCAAGNCMLPFNVSAPVTSGQVYTFQFIPGAGIPDPYGVQVEDPGTYTGGEMYLVDPSGTSPTGFDMVFETFIALPGGLHYQWSTDSTDTAIMVYASGNYTVTVSDSSGCAASVSANVTVNPAPTINPVSGQTVCTDKPVAAINFSGSLTGTTYDWSNNDSSIGLAASGTGSIASFKALNSGTVPVVASITVTPALSISGSAYIANAYTNSVSVINIATNTVTATIPNVSQPYGVSVSPDGSKVYVSDNLTSDNTVTVISTATNTITASVTVGYEPAGVVVSPDGSRVYVANSSSHTVSVISAANNTVIATIAVGNTPLGITISPDGSKVFVVNCFGDSVSVINAANNTVITTFSCGATGGESGILLSPNGSNIYVADFDGTAVDVINAANYAVVATVTVPRGASGLAISPDGSKLYVACYYADTVSVINTSTNEVTDNIPVGTSPLGLSITADGSMLYVANEGSNAVYVINTSNDSIIDKITVGTGPFTLGNFIINKGGGCPGKPIIFDITVDPNVTSQVSQAICAGSSFDGHSLPGIYVDSFTANSGCDSIRTLNLTMLPPLMDTIVKTICAGTSFDGHSLPGVYIDSFTTANGCDSIRILDLTVSPPVTDTIVATICAGTSFDGRSLPGVYIDSFTTTNGCDSIRILDLTVSPPVTDTIVTTICAGSSFDSYSLPGIYIDSFATANGCDSIRILNLAVSPPAMDTIVTTICTGQGYEGHDTTGTYLDTFTTSAGCDSIRLLNLTIMVYNSISKVYICQGDTFQGHTTAGIFFDTLLSTSGCDSIITQELSIYPLPTAPVITRDNDTLFSSVAFHYQWLKGDTLLTGDTLNSLIISGNGEYGVEITDNNGCNNRSAAYYVLNLGVAQLANTPGASVYPNPTDGLLNIRLSALDADAPVNLKVYNVLGNLLMEQTLSNSNTMLYTEINMNDLPQELYLLQISQKDWTMNQRVMLQR